ncbi:hypothetical protein PFICI_04329 [Pestalotiopsis fici W106-1]|uniref:Wax synthase domain-containing protein n=1 Tax=Pestalotiopsis fici (strain W106-1 / CGMCC3.15140) TaxID=1229662 RepID=W3X8K4_PESFW|nr:uncharacterized protein PFICI_04329 [Pestalotiopsis fici W106-1]ETS82453.1 hypothetical protein PFICI_04329 [Pestalotiopsis fici W106-1]
MQFAHSGIDRSALMLRSFGIEAAFLAFFVAILGTIPQAIFKRACAVMLLAALTYAMENSIVPLCRSRPHWAATAASLLWVQFLSASKIIVVSRVQMAQVAPRHRSALARARSVTGLLWNMRRNGTQWQVKNVPSVKGLQKQGRVDFILRRFAVTISAYLFVDIVVSLPPADPAMVHVDKAALFPPHGLSLEDLIFRAIMTASYFLMTGLLNLCMANVGAIISVATGLSRPTECPPLYGSFADAYSVRRFWGISWHQMFRIFLTGHAKLIIDAVLPFSRQSAMSRYVRQTVAFLISGAIHYRAEQLMGVPDKENGALVFFMMHSAIIILEDAVQPLISGILPRSLSRPLGYLWVVAFFVWTTPPWMYPGSRLGIDPAALLPFRVLGPFIAK